MDGGGKDKRFRVPFAKASTSSERMKLQFMILIAALGMLSPYAQALPADGPWAYKHMERRVRLICKGSNGNTILRLAHPVLVARSAYRNWTEGNVFTESILNPETAAHLMSMTKEKMVASDSCYDIAAFFFNYELMGYEALRALRQAFNDSGIAEICTHDPADDESVELYRRCSRLDLPSDLMFSRNMIDLVHRRTFNRLLLTKQPKSCADIEVIDNEIYSAFTAAQRKLSKKLRVAGF